MRLLVALLALLVFAAPASANWQEDRALMVAQVVWHHPCVDAAKFAVVDQVGIDRGVNLAPGEHVGARADASTCTINVGSMFPSATTDWNTWCMIVVHESGHLAGYRDPTNTTDPQHSLNPRSVMFSRPFYEPRCEFRGRPLLEKHGRLAPRRKH